MPGHGARPGAHTVRESVRGERSIVDLKAIAREKLNATALRGDNRAQLIGGSAAGLAVLLVVLLLVLTTCSGGDAKGDGGSQPAGAGADDQAKGPSEAEIRIAPKDGAD